MIFGGYDEYNKGRDQNFLLEIQDQNNFTIKEINTKKLPYSEGFWNNQAIIFNRKVYAIQNYEIQDQNNECYENKRRVLVFNSNKWL